MRYRAIGGAFRPINAEAGRNAGVPGAVNWFMPISTLPENPPRLANRPAAGTDQPAIDAFALSLAPRPGENVLSAVGRLAESVEDRKATILKLMVFAPLDAQGEVSDAMRRHFRKVDWPVTWVQGDGCNGAPIAGMQAFATTGADVRRIVIDGQIVGSVYQDCAARYCFLGGLGPRYTAPSQAIQAVQVFENMEAALADAGFGLGDIVRTWFYNKDLLAWYGDFNRVRTALYARIRFRSGSLPASTGISGRNPDGAALVAGALAVQPLRSSVRAMEVGSPLQCPAPSYGSSFSRAMEIATPTSRNLMVSGTASIAPDGRSVWVGDAPRQVALTMDVVEAILRSRGFAFADVTRAIAYFKHPRDTPAFDAWCASRGLEAMPVIRTHCGICRDDLLFEIEMDATARDS
jgi:enamine deaminase RidA (YjgF/YER057c/UK114 family)